MDGLRKVNKRRRAFNAQPMRASRRKFQYGGFVDAAGNQNPEPVEGGRPAEAGNLTVDSSRSYTNTSAGSSELPRFQGGGWAAGVGLSDPEQVRARAEAPVGSTRTFDTSRPAAPNLGTPSGFSLRAQRAPRPTPMGGAGLGSGFSGQRRFTGPDRLWTGREGLRSGEIADYVQRRQDSFRASPASRYRTSAGTEGFQDGGEVTSHDKPKAFRKGGKAGLKGYQDGGEVNELYTEEELRKRQEQLNPAAAAAVAPGLDPTSGVTVGRARYGSVPMQAPTSVDTGLREPSVASPGEGLVQGADSAGEGLLRGAEAVGKAMTPASQVNVNPPARGFAERMAQSVQHAQNARALREGKPLTNVIGEQPLVPTVAEGLAQRPAVTADATGKDALRPTSYETDAEAGARGAQTQRVAQSGLTKSFGLRAGAKRTEVEGSPGVSKYRDARGKTLYSNVDRDVKGMKPTDEQVKYAQGVAADEAKKLSGFVQARAMSGSPEDLEFARQLAVTPEHRMAIAHAENLQGLRQRASGRGPAARAALLELKGKMDAETEGLRANRALQVAALNKQPGPLEIRADARAEDANVRAGEEARRTAEAERRTAALKYIDDTVKGQFTDDDKGKAQATEFRQNLVATIPHIKSLGGDPSKMTPKQLSVALALNDLRTNKATGRLWNSDKGSRNLLDFVPVDLKSSFWNTEVVLRGGGTATLRELARGRTDLRNVVLEALTDSGKAPPADEDYG